MNKYNDSLLYKVLRPLARGLFLLLYTPKIVGSENIPSKGRVILAGNHINVLDAIFLMSTTKRGIHFLAKKELWKGLKGVLFSRMGLIPVDRSKHNPDALNNAFCYLENEKVIGIFPEGTTEKGRGLLPFKIGAVKMAYEKDSVIIPFAITGKYRLFSNNLKIVFDKPFKIESSSLDKENKKLRDRISFMIEEGKNVNI